MIGRYSNNMNTAFWIDGDRTRSSMKSNLDFMAPCQEEGDIMVSTVNNPLPVRYMYLHSMMKSCQAITIPRKYGCVCVALFEGERQNTTGNSIFAVTKKFSPLRTTTQLAIPKKNVFAPDQKSIENRLPNRRNQ
jgi:hypothetical protein